MKVILSVGGRFHAHHLAQQLAKRQSLACLYSFSSPTPAYSVQQHHLGSWLDWAYFKMRLNHLLAPSAYNTFKDTLFDGWVARQLPKLLAQDLFVVWANYGLQSIAVARSLGAKVIVESGSAHIEHQQEVLASAYVELGLKHQPIVQKNKDRMMAEYASADAIMTLSSVARQSFIDRGHAPGKVLQVSCGVDVQTFFVNRRCQQEQPIFTVLFVGLLSIRKGVHHLIDAWLQLDFDPAKTRLLLIGTLHHDLGKILKKKKLRTNIIFYGSASQDQLKSLYQQASVFVLPSLEDGFGMVVGEAMAAGLPIICTTHVGAADLITAGQEGLVVPAGSSILLAQALLWMYEHRYDAWLMGQRGQKKIQRYTWDYYGEQVYEKYKQVLEM